MKPTSRKNAGRIAAASIGAAAAALLVAPLITNAAESPGTALIAGTDEPDDTIEPADTAAEDGTTDVEVDDEVANDEEVPQPAELPGPPDGPGQPDGPGFPGRREGGAGHGRFRIVNAEVIAGALGIDVETLRDELRSGATVAEIAEANGVDPQVVIDALVAEYTDRVTSWIEGEQPVVEQSTETDTETDTDTGSPDTTTATTSA